MRRYASLSLSLFVLGAHLGRYPNSVFHSCAMVFLQLPKASTAAYAGFAGAAFSCSVFLDAPNCTQATMLHENFAQRNGLAPPARLPRLLFVIPQYGSKACTRHAS